MFSNGHIQWSTSALLALLEGLDFLFLWFQSVAGCSSPAHLYGPFHLQVVYNTITSISSITSLSPLKSPPHYHLWNHLLTITSEIRKFSISNTHNWDQLSFFRALPDYVTPITDPLSCMLSLTLGLLTLLVSLACSAPLSSGLFSRSLHLQYISHNVQLSIWESYSSSLSNSD